MKTAFITGVTGQDGSYLAELLLEKGYVVHSIMRRSSVFTTDRIEHLMENPKMIVHHGDLTDSSNIHRLIVKIRPDEVYNLGAQSHVKVSFDVPEYTADVDALGAIRLLDAIRDLDNGCKYYQASTSELFGGIPGTEPQSETTPFYPKSPYGVAKLYAYWITINYRDSYGIYACNGILFNHESPRRGETFVTKKITQAVAKIFKGEQDNLQLGNIDAKKINSMNQKIYGELVYKKPNIKLLSQNKNTNTLIFELHEGKNREIRKICEIFNLRVDSLKRINFGQYHLKGIPIGGYKEIII